MIAPRDVTGLKIGITRDYFWDYCQDDVGAVVENAIDELVTAGAASLELPLPEAAASIQVWGEGAIVASEGYAFLQSQLPAWIDSLDPNVRVRMETALEAKTLDYHGALYRIRNLSASVHAKLDAVDVLAVPTAPITPPRLSDVEDPEEYKSKILLSLSNTMPGNVLGICAVTLPTGLDRAGMPVGLQLIARPNREEDLIAIALGIERVLGTPRDRLGSPLVACKETRIFIMQASKAPLIDGVRCPRKIFSFSPAPSTPPVRLCDCQMKGLELYIMTYELRRRMK